MMLWVVLLGGVPRSLLSGPLMRESKALSPDDLMLSLTTITFYSVKLYSIQRAITSRNYLLYMTWMCLQKVRHSVPWRHHCAVLLSLCEVLNFSLQFVIEAQNACDIATPEIIALPSQLWRTPVFLPFLESRSYEFSDIFTV